MIFVSFKIVVPQFWKKRKLRNCLLKMNGLYALLVDNFESPYNKSGLRKVLFLVQKRSNRPSLVESVTSRQRFLQLFYCSLFGSGSCQIRNIWTEPFDNWQLPDNCPSIAWQLPYDFHMTAQWLTNNWMMTARWLFNDLELWNVQNDSNTLKRKFYTIVTI